MHHWLFDETLFGIVGSLGGAIKIGCLDDVICFGLRGALFERVTTLRQLFAVSIQIRLVILRFDQLVFEIRNLAANTADGEIGRRRFGRQCVELSAADDRLRCRTERRDLVSNYRARIGLREHRRSIYIVVIRIFGFESKLR